MLAQKKARKNQHPTRTKYAVCYSVLYLYPIRRWWTSRYLRSPPHIHGYMNNNVMHAKMPGASALLARQSIFIYSAHTITVSTYVLPNETFLRIYASLYPIWFCFSFIQIFIHRVLARSFADLFVRHTLYIRWIFASCVWWCCSCFSFDKQF